VLEDRVTPSTFLVTNTSDDLRPGSLRAAITQANLRGNEASTVEITAAVTGPIRLTAGELPVLASMTIENLSGAPVDIRQDTAGARVFHVAGSRAITVTVTGLTGAVTIDGGSVRGNGGGFLVDNSQNTLTLTDVRVVGNSAAGGQPGGGNGGGIYSRGAVVLDGSVVGTTADPNRATKLAGGVWADCGLTLRASTVDGNRAGADGGGVVVGNGNVTLTDMSSISYNRAPDGMGGGVIVLSGSVFVTGGSHVDGNAARNNGGIVEGRGNVTVLGGSTVNGNSSTGHDVSAGDWGGWRHRGGPRQHLHLWQPGQQQPHARHGKRRYRQHCGQRDRHQRLPGQRQHQRGPRRHRRQLRIDGHRERRQPGQSQHRRGHRRRHCQLLPGARQRDRLRRQPGQRQRPDQQAIPRAGTRRLFEPPHPDPETHRPRGRGGRRGRRRHAPRPPPGRRRRPSGDPPSSARP
jgi:hypothetical protein